MSYSPSIGRFLEMDPDTYVDGPNEYQFEKSNPVDSTDSTGLADQRSGPATQPATPATQPTTQAAPTTKPSAPISGKVSAVTGRARYRSDPNQQWQDVRQGMNVVGSTEFQIGPRSSVQVTLSDGGPCPPRTITITKFGSTTLDQAASPNFNNDPGVKRGRIHYNIEAPGVEHESTPNEPWGDGGMRD